jgi:hypothetical protein
MEKKPKRKYTRKTNVGNNIKIIDPFDLVSEKLEQITKDVEAFEKKRTRNHTKWTIALFLFGILGAVAWGY